MQLSEEELEKEWVEVLAYVYKAVNWRKIRGKSSYDVFEHRLTAASMTKDVPSLIQKLCNLLSLQAPKLPMESVRKLRENDKEAMKLVRKMSKLLTLEAAERAKELR